MLLHDYQGKLLQLDFLLLEQQGCCCCCSMLGLAYLVLVLDVLLDIVSDMASGIVLDMASGIVLDLLLFEAQL